MDLAIIFICSFMIYPRYREYKEIKKGFEMTYDKIFGENFTQKCIDSAIDTLKKKNKDNHQESEDKHG